MLISLDQNLTKAKLYELLYMDYLDFGLILLMLKVFDHVREPNRQTIVTVSKSRWREI